MKFLKEKTFELWDPILFVLLCVFSNSPAQTSKVFSFKNFMRDMGMKKGRSYKFVFIIFSLLIFIHCGGTSSNLPPTSGDPVPRDQTIPPTRNVTRDPACPPATQPIPFITEVVSYKIGPGGGLNSHTLQDSYPKNVVLGPPKGTGTHSGSKDVFSLGEGGEIIVKMGTPILNGNGADFVVFENVFYAGDDPDQPYMEPGEVSVSQDGLNFITFSCHGEDEDFEKFYPGCAGIHPVFANVNHKEIDPTDSKVAGGDPFDLEDLHLNCVQFIKIKDALPLKHIDITLPTDQEGEEGFDLDAISAVYY